MELLAVLFLSQSANQDWYPIRNPLTKPSLALSIEKTPPSQ